MEQESEAVLRKETVRMTERDDQDFVRYVNEQAKEKSVENYYDERRIQELYQWSMQFESDYKERIRQKEKYLEPLERDKDFRRAQKYLSGEKKEELSNAYTHFQTLLEERISKAEREDAEHKESLKNQYRDFVGEMDRFVEREYRKALEQREEDYLHASEELKKAESIEDYQRILTVLEKIGDYKESHSLSGQCMEEIQKLQELEEQERIRLEQEREQERIRLEQEREQERLRLEQEREQERIRKEQERLRLKQEKEEAKAKKQQERAEQRKERELAQMMQEQEAQNTTDDTGKKPVFAVLKWVVLGILLVGVGVLAYLTIIRPSDSEKSFGKQKKEVNVADSGQQEKPLETETDEPEETDVPPVEEEVVEEETVEPEETNSPQPTTESLFKQGDHITFGTYEQDNDKTNGAEEIEWLVLDVRDGKALVISKYGLDCKQYHMVSEDVAWETCTLRQWLNEEFYQTAFTQEERNKIETIGEEDNLTYPTGADEDTGDKVFILSIAEAEMYFASDEARECFSTEYAIANGVWSWGYYMSGSKMIEGCGWWLRTSNRYVDSAAYVDGGLIIDVDEGIDILDASLAVRPALWIDIQDFECLSN